jgi:hypothetical protein
VLHSLLLLCDHLYLSGLGFLGIITHRQAHVFLHSIDLQRTNPSAGYSILVSLSTHRAEHSCSCRRSSPTPHESAGKYSEIAQHDLRKGVSYIDGSLPQQCFLYCPLFDVFLLLGFSYFLLLATMRWFSCVSWSLALLLLRTGHVLARLPQKQTNGNSLLGDLSQSSLAEFLTETSLPDGYPWGKATAFNTNYYTSSPNTGFVPSYL